MTPSSAITSGELAGQSDLTHQFGSDRVSTHELGADPCQCSAELGIDAGGAA